MLACCEIKPSRCFALLLGVFHCLVFLLVWVTDMPLWLQLILALIIVLNGLYTLHCQVLLRGCPAWRAFSIEGEKINISTRGGDELAGVVLIKTLVTIYFIVLRVRLDDRSKTISQIIFFDALPADTFRELRTRLRLL